jgi:3-oxoacyl-[acyl-carrier protein] reductase
MTGRHTEKVVLVTGASGGLGEAIASRFVDAGALVALAAPAFAPADAVAEQLGSGAIALTGDVTSPADVGRVVGECVERLGRLDVLVNNAGVGAVAPSAKLSYEQWQQTLAVNLTGPFLCSQAAYPHLSERGGVIVNVASIFAEVGIPQRAAYAATKHGLVGLTRVLATEWARDGIRVVAVEPAYVKTNLDARDRESGGYTDEDIAGRTPLGRFGEPGEIAAVIDFLSSDDASFVTGSATAIDGGWLAYGGW